MTYATPSNPGWRPLRWPAVKLVDGGLVSPGPEGATPALLDAVGATPIVDPGPLPDVDQVADSGTLTDVDGVPTVVYEYRPKTADELAADAQAAQDETDRQQARLAVTNLRAYIDLSSPTAAQRLAFERLVARVAIRLIRDSYA